jgi:hypothetical protein
MTNSQLRTLASQHVLALTGTKDGVELLVRADAAEVLCRRIGDIDVSREPQGSTEN